MTKPFRIDIPPADSTTCVTGSPAPGGPGSYRATAGAAACRWTTCATWRRTGRTGYDWRAHEARLNEFPQFITEIDGLDVHYIHVRSKEPDALPLILTHGWPNSIVEFTEADRPAHRSARLRRGSGAGVPRGRAVGARLRVLAGAAATGFTFERVARMWAELMGRLGYDRFGTQGGDLGAYLAPAVARVAPERVVGVHIDGGFGMPTAADVPDMNEAERAEWDQMQRWMNAGGVDHHALLRAAPQTFAYAWTDSPVGLLAWVVQKFKEFTYLVPTPEQAIARDLILTNVSLYWFTGTSGSSSWPMYERLTIADDGGFAWPEGQRRVPSGVYGGGSALMRRLAERDNTIVHWPEGNTGGHFVAMELPLAHAADIRAFFSALR